MNEHKQRAIAGIEHILRQWNQPTNSTATRYLMLSTLFDAIKNDTDWPISDNPTTEWGKAMVKLWDGSEHFGKGQQLTGDDAIEALNRLKKDVEAQQ